MQFQIKETFDFRPVAGENALGLNVPTWAQRANFPVLGLQGSLVGSA